VFRIDPEAIRVRKSLTGVKVVSEREETMTDEARVEGHETELAQAQLDDVAGGSLKAASSASSPCLNRRFLGTGGRSAGDGIGYAAAGRNGRIC